MNSSHNYIEQLYNLVGIEPDFYLIWDSHETQLKNFQEVHDYPEFSSEVQLSLIQLIAKRHLLEILEIKQEDSSYWLCQVRSGIHCEHKDFSQALSGLVCKLTEKCMLDKDEVRKVLGK